MEKMPNNGEPVITEPEETEEESREKTVEEIIAEYEQNKPASKPVKLGTLLLIAAVLLGFTLCVFGPFNIYIGNQTEFDFALGDILPYTAIFGVGLGLLAYFVGRMLLKTKAGTVYTAALFALDVMFYLQGNILNPSYGALDGRRIAWNEYTVYAIWSTALWIAIIGLCILLIRKKEELFKKAGVFIGCALLALEVITVSVTLITTPLQDKERNWSVTDEGVNTVSADENTIIILVDACDTQYFAEIKETNPEVFEGWDGFVYFPNFSGSYSKTKMSVPYILSGKWYENEATVKNFLQSAYEDVNLWNTLQENGYDIRLFTSPTYLDEDLVGIAANLSSAKTVVMDHWGLSYQVMRLVGFVYVPHVFKQYLETYTGDGAYHKYFGNTDGQACYSGKNLLFAERVSQPLQTVEEKAFRFIHITGSHLPCNINENGEDVGSWNATEIQQTTAVFRWIGLYLEQLKELGVYDDATIIVMADHGRFDDGVSFPTFTIKAPHATGALTENEAPACQADLHATILSLAGLEVPEGEQTVFDISTDEERERRLLYYPKTFANGGYLPDLTEYAIDNTLNPTETGRVYTRNGVITAGAGE